MGLPLAIKAHQQGNTKLACEQYQRALDQGDNTELIFQNYGSLLRDLGRHDCSRDVYIKGLELYPKSKGIRKNFANLIRSTQPTRALSIEFELLHEHISSSNEINANLFIPIIEILVSLESYLWAYQISAFALRYVAPNTQLLILLLKIISSKRLDIVNNKMQAHIKELIEIHLTTLSPVQVAEFKFAAAWLESEKGNFDIAVETLQSARKSLLSVDPTNIDDKEKASLLNNVNSWNMANMMLAAQDFRLGWDLFEYGLRAKAPGAQKWQRALPKPFTYSQLKVWRGENLTNKSILLLEEQAIGDVMQFITLVPKLIEESSHLGLLISERLVKIYQRTFAPHIQNNRLSIYCFSDVSTGHLDPNQYDYQSPIGSICQHRFTNIAEYGKFIPLLIPSPDDYEKLRSDYLSSTSNKLIVGLSWRGGGREDRIKQKSLSVDLFSKLIFGLDNIIFVSLQYGDVRLDVQDFRRNGCEVIHDESINPLRDMDGWLSQVAACDSVLSVANTTIHGAGGLNKPTMCMLSQDSDWRWLKNPSVERSYWYPSVGIARQSTSKTWDTAFRKARLWLESGCQYPQGRTFV